MEVTNEVAHWERTLTTTKKCIYQLPRPFNVHSCYVARGGVKETSKIT